MKHQNHSKVIILLVIFMSLLHHGLCSCSLSSENSSVLLHCEVLIRVGVILDMKSWAGQSIHSFITMAISDLYALNDIRTRIVLLLHTRDSKGDPSQALSDVLDLLNNIKVQAIIGPETYLEAKLLAPIANRAKVSIFSFAGSASMNDPYLFQVKEDESFMADSIASLVKTLTWRDVIFLYEDADDEWEILSHFLESSQDEIIRIVKKVALPALATDNQIIYDLQKVMISNTTSIILHMSSSLASRVFLIAKRLGMVSEEYIWIITYKTIDIGQSEDYENTRSLQGVIGLRSNIPLTSKLLNLTTRWYNECYIIHPALASREVSVLAIWAYDTIWVLAESVQKLGVQFSLDVPQINSMLINEVSRTIFKGVSGEFRLINGKLVSNGFKIVKVIGNGGSVITPGRRMLQTSPAKHLKVGVLISKKFKFFTDAYYDKENNVITVTGFSVDVFKTCIDGLPYEVSYELIPFSNGTYDDLVIKVFSKDIDAILGDTTILSNRSRYVDFTMPYTDPSVGILAKVKHNNDIWIFLKPFNVDLWLTTVGFVILTGFVIWAIEAIDQGSQRLSAHELGETFWFILMTLFFFKVIFLRFIRCVHMIHKLHANFIREMIGSCKIYIIKST